jgi:hypothetical protein
MLTGCANEYTAPTYSATTPAYDWYGEPSIHALDRWEAVRGAPTDACRAYAQAIAITWVNATQLDAHCGDDLVGCFQPAGGWLNGKQLTETSIYVRDDQYARIPVHEMMHAVSFCMNGDTDGLHSDAALWAGLLCDGTEGSCPP